MAKPTGLHFKANWAALGPPASSSAFKKVNASPYGEQIHVEVILSFTRAYASKALHRLNIDAAAFDKAASKPT